MTIQSNHILYDVAQAQMEINQKNIEVPQQNRKAQIHNAFLIAIIGIVETLLIVGIISIMMPSPHEVPKIRYFSMASVIVALLALGRFVYQKLSHNVLASSEWYSTNAQYYAMIQGQHVLKLEVIQDNGDNILCITTEDDNHVVSKHTMWQYPLEKITCTDITEPKIDMMKAVVYVPYIA